MNENYLWDKTESDPDIERLENALRVFRYEEKLAPKLPMKVLPFKQKSSPRRIFPAALKIAACFAIGAVALATWMQIFKMNLNVERASSELNNQKIPPENLHSKQASALHDVPAANEQMANSIPERKIYRVRHKTVSANFRRTEQKRAKAVVAAEPAVRLTKEEKHAYDQLMLALSITSSNLKAVKNQAEGLE